MYIKSAYNREPSSIYRGIVEDNKDPKGLGRCKIRVPSVFGELSYPISVLPWARPVVLSPVGENRGSVNIPDVGDIVWVMFEGSNRDYPIYFGGTYAVGDMSVDNRVVDIHLEEDSKLSYDRDNKTYTLKVADISITVSDSGVIINGDTKIIGDLSVTGNMTVSGTTTLSNLIILGSCNKECDCP